LDNRTEFARYHTMRRVGPPFDPASTFKRPSLSRADGPTTGAQTAMRTLRSGRADILIVGNGIAGLTAAVEAREYAPDASILIVTEQNHPTINTPALKQFGAGRIEVDQLPAYPPGMERDVGIGIANLRVERVDIRAGAVELGDGQRIKYGRLLLATGAEPTSLPPDCPGRNFDGVMTLHTLRDYQDLRRRLEAVGSVVVIGGGYHAAETAIMLRHRHLRVTWLVRGRGILSGELDTPASDILLRHIERLGVDVRLETELAGVVGRMGAAVGVVTSAQEFIPCQLVIACIGVRPDVALVKDTGLAATSARGVQVNERLQTRAPNIFAAGAVAAVLDPQTGQHVPRGQWYFAFQQGRLAGALLAGARVSPEATAKALGCFWHATQIEKVSVLAAGASMASERDHPDNEVLTDGASDWYRRIVVRHDRLVGYLSVGPKQANGLAIKRLIDEQIPIGAIRRQLLARDFDVRSFLTSSQVAALQSGKMRALPAPARAPAVAERSRQYANPA
jgi:NADPH-dependent 2,4-dienoyl-CoA reductase/sulfur reductase-like enzyme